MAHILLLETATDVCSVALAEDQEIRSIRELKGEKSHSAKLIGFIHEVLEESGISYKDLDAVAVSKGPGSYTGLRIGVSTAKGICYGSNKPLIAIPSLQSLANSARKQERVELHPESLLCPMIDARRMEVYTALYRTNLSEYTSIEAKVIDEESFRTELDKQKIYFFGNGAEKTKEVIQHPNAVHLPEIELSSRGMVELAFEAFHQSRFEDVAYFEPFYLKDFLATVPRKKVF